MRKDTFVLVRDLLGLDSIIGRGQPVSADVQLQIALRFFETGSFKKDNQFLCYIIYIPINRDDFDRFSCFLNAVYSVSS